MREGAQTVHEGMCKFILDELCKEEHLTPKNQKIFYDEENKKWYIADFFIPEFGIVIEIDGLSHANRQSYDAKRTEFIEKLGHRVLRFRNDEIESPDFREKLKDAIIKTASLAYK